MKVRSLRSADIDVKPGDAVVIVNPGPTAQWEAGLAIAARGGPKTPVVFLNSQLSENYNLGGPLPSVEEVFYLRIITKGWAYRGYPNPWQAVLEAPDGSVQTLKSFPKGEKPELRVMSELTRTESMNRYAIFNDRYTNDPMFGGRL
jgi:hypothetical protein